MPAKSHIHRKSSPASAALFAAFAALALIAGCYETTLHLGSSSDAKVDRKLVGDWKLFNPDNPAETANLVVRNFDDKQYYAEWEEKDGKRSRMRARGFTIKSATFFEITDVTDDGQVPDKHIILRVDLKDDKLALRHLDDKFFADVKTDKQLRAKVEGNLDNEAMYDGKPITGTRIAAP